MSKNKEERAKQLYLQAVKAYKIGKPDIFNSQFTVPAELLYQDTCKLNINDERRLTYRQIYDARLKALIKDEKDFDYEYLTTDIVKTIMKQPLGDFIVYFGVPIKKASNIPLPFNASFKLDGTTFRRISDKQFMRAHTKKCLNDYHSKCEDNLSFRESRTWIMKNFYYFRANVKSLDDITAVNIVVNAFEVLYVCATVAQNGNSYRHTLGGVKTKSRSVIAPPGLLLVSKDKDSDCELFWTSDIRMKSEETLSFTANTKKMNRFSLYKRICREDSIVSKRIRLLLFEFAKALHAEEPHIRQLGLWRCLELGTGKQGSSRPEKEIIQILSNYYRESQHWKQQGDIVKDVRNKFVHQGASLERDSWGSVDKYLNWTQEYVDSLLGILLWLRKNDFKSASDIDDFFDLYYKPKSTLEIANKLLKARSKS